MATQIELTDISFEDLRAPDFRAHIMGLRNQNVRLLRLRLPSLSWTSILVCAPVDHLFGMAYQLMSPSHGKWLGTLDESGKQLKAFNLEHSSRGIALSKIPDGFYCYGSTNPRLPRQSRLGVDVEPLSRTWFLPFLLPTTDECEEIFLGWILQVFDQLGWFVLRPVLDKDVQPEKWPGSDSDHLEYLLFRGFGKHGGGTTGNRLPQLREIVSVLKDAVMNWEKGIELHRELLGPGFTYFGGCEFHRRSSIFSAEESVLFDEINSLRARLARLSSWPLFYKSCQKWLSDLKWDYEPWQATQTIPYNPAAEVREYLEECRQRYPVLESDPFADAWTQGRMPKGEGRELKALEALVGKL